MRLRSMLILMAALSVCACERDDDKKDGGPTPGMDAGPLPDGATGEENTVAACTDGIDNDGNGWIDCDDFGCCAVVTCGAETACGSCEPSPENTEEACTDGMDNDCDGRIDCNDFDCSAFCPVENSNPLCSDGLDNDGNGHIDCDDFACKERIVCAGEATNANCSDGVDNDGDGKEDCQDEDCHGEGIVVCDGTTPVTVTEAELAGLVATRCSNGMDDNGNNYFDCGDNSCLWNHPGCEEPAPERGNAACSDGIDNDFDGKTDCEEEACRAEGTVVCRNFEADGRTPIVPPMAEWEELSNTECSNGVNDDAEQEGDRPFIDCADNNCTQSPDVTIECEGENTNAKCSDGVDNDPEGAYGHTFIDCNDNKCRDNPRVTVCPSETSFEACSNGIDDDGNGHTDCRDHSCRPPEGSSGHTSPACY